MGKLDYSHLDIPFIFEVFGGRQGTYYTLQRKLSLESYSTFPDVWLSYLATVNYGNESNIWL
jgi:hypothetical protein